MAFTNQLHTDFIKSDEQFNNHIYNAQETGISEKLSYQSDEEDNSQDQDNNLERKTDESMECYSRSFEDQSANSNSGDCYDEACNAEVKRERYLKPGHGMPPIAPHFSEMSIAASCHNLISAEYSVSSDNDEADTIKSRCSTANNSQVPYLNNMEEVASESSACEKCVDKEDDENLHDSIVINAPECTLNSSDHAVTHREISSALLDVGVLRSNPASAISIYIQTVASTSEFNHSVNTDSKSDRTPDNINSTNIVHSREGTHDKTDCIFEPIGQSNVEHFVSTYADRDGDSLDDTCIKCTRSELCAINSEIDFVGISERQKYTPTCAHSPDVNTGCVDVASFNNNAPRNKVEYVESQEEEITEGINNSKTNESFAGQNEFATPGTDMGLLPAGNERNIDTQSNICNAESESTDCEPTLNVASANNSELQHVPHVNVCDLLSAYMNVRPDKCFGIDEVFWMSEVQNLACEATSESGKHTQGPILQTVSSCEHGRDFEDESPNASKLEGRDFPNQDTDHSAEACDVCNAPVDFLVSEPLESAESYKESDVNLLPAVQLGSVGELCGKNKFPSVKRNILNLDEYDQSRKTIADSIPVSSRSSGTEFVQKEFVGNEDNSLYRQLQSTESCSNDDSVMDICPPDLGKGFPEQEDDKQVYSDTVKLSSEGVIAGGCTAVGNDWNGCTGVSFTEMCGDVTDSDNVSNTNNVSSFGDTSQAPEKVQKSCRESCNSISTQYHTLSDECKSEATNIYDLSSLDDISQASEKVQISYADSCNSVDTISKACSEGCNFAATRSDNVSSINTASSLGDTSRLPEQFQISCAESRNSVSTQYKTCYSDCKSVDTDSDVSNISDLSQASEKDQISCADTCNRLDANSEACHEGCKSAATMSDGISNVNNLSALNDTLLSEKAHSSYADSCNSVGTKSNASSITGENNAPQAPEHIRSIDLAQSDRVSGDLQYTKFALNKVSQTANDDLDYSQHHQVENDDPSVDFGGEKISSKNQSNNYDENILDKSILTSFSSKTLELYNRISGDGDMSKDVSDSSEYEIRTSRNLEPEASEGLFKSELGESSHVSSSSSESLQSSIVTQENVNTSANIEEIPTSYTATTSNEDQFEFEMTPIISEATSISDMEDSDNIENGEKPHEHLWPEFHAHSDRELIDTASTENSSLVQESVKEKFIISPEGTVLSMHDASNEEVVPLLPSEFTVSLMSSMVSLLSASTWRYSPLIPLGSKVQIVLTVMGISSKIQVFCNKGYSNNSSLRHENSILLENGSEKLECLGALNLPKELLLDYHLRLRNSSAFHTKEEIEPMCPETWAGAMSCVPLSWLIKVDPPSDPRMGYYSHILNLYRENQLLLLLKRNIKQPAVSISECDNDNTLDPISSIQNEYFSSDNEVSNSDYSDVSATESLTIQSNWSSIVIERAALFILKMFVKLVFKMAP